MAQVLAEDGSTTPGVVNELIDQIGRPGGSSLEWIPYQRTDNSFWATNHGRPDGYAYWSAADRMAGHTLPATLSMGEQPPPQTKDNPSTFAVEFNQSALDVLPSCGRFSDEWHDVARKF